jgi:hypothetical protein
MALAKASLQAVRPERELIPFLFNPSQYTLDAGNQIAEIGVPGLAAPVLQFVRGGGRTLSLDLLLDAYEQRLYGGREITDITDLADAIYALLAPTPETGAPPVCMFAWKDRRLQCIVERVSGRFTLFSTDGAPLRATLALTLREYADAEVVVSRRSAEAGAGGTRVVKQGDTLSGIAHEVYGEAGRWREIASANRISNPRRLQPGQVLVIPGAGR